MEPIAVDVWSDIACPWCYIGKRRFEEGVTRYRAAGGERDVEVLYHSYELSPDTPVDFEGSEAEFLAGFKGMDHQQVRQLLGEVGFAAQTVGLNYDFEALQHTRTLKAHQVIHLAEARGRQAEVVERLFSAYFVEGRHVGHDDDLADLAAEAGLDRAEVLQVLADGTFADAVTADLQLAESYGIRGVPFYVLDGRLAVSGAQNPDLFAQALAQAQAQAQASEPG